MKPFIYRAGGSAVPAPLTKDGTPDLDAIRATYNPSDTLVEPGAYVALTPVRNLADRREARPDTVRQLKAEHPEYFLPEPLRAWFAIDAGGRVRTDWDAKRKAFVAVGFRSQDEASAYWNDPARHTVDRACGIAERRIVE